MTTNATTERRFRPGDRVRLTGHKWGDRDTWSERFVGAVLTLSHAVYDDSGHSGRFQWFRFVEDPPGASYWYVAKGWEIELVQAAEADRAQREA